MILFPVGWEGTWQVHETVRKVCLERPERQSARSPETAAAVEKAMAKLGYVPNQAATTPRKGRSQIIGLVVPDIANPYFADVAKGAQDAAEQHNRSVLIASAGTKANDARQLSLLRCS
jgi:LacI family transcriptional regulator